MDNETQTVDLEKQREERCAPIAQAIIKDLGALTPGADGKTSLDQVFTATKQRFLDADLNVETEAPYVFQLILDTFSKLNAAAQAMELTPVDFARYDAIKGKVLTSLANDGDQSTANIQALFQGEKLSPIEVKYILEDMLASLNAVQDAVLGAIENAVGIAEAKLFGVETMHDLSMSVLDKALGGATQAVPENPAAAPTE